MKPPMKRALLLLDAILLVALFPAQLAWGNDDLSEQLKSDYVGKVLTLRHFYEGKQLSFESDGVLNGHAKEGPWTLDGQISVNEIRVDERWVRIKARRLYLVFDAKGKPYRDLLGTKKHYRENLVDIDIMLTSANPTEQDVSKVMNAVFLGSGESMREVVPDFWQGYFDKLEGRPNSPVESTAVFMAGRGISPPHVVHQVDPEFSEAARRANYHGTMAMAVVVDPSGSVKNIEITSPVGMGLDENGIDAVKRWKFKPGMKDGEPVAVKIAVEMEFRQY